MLRIVLVSVLLTTVIAFGNAASLGEDISKASNVASTLAGVVRDCATPSSGGSDERVWECLAGKAAAGVERAVRALVLEWRQRDVPLADNVVLAAADHAATGRAALDSASSLPELLSQFLASRTLEIKFPKDLVPAVATNFEQARGKLKKAGGLVAGMLMMKGALGAMALGALALIAGKALILAKLSLLLSVVAALKKSGGGGGGSDHRRSGRRADHVPEGDAAAGSHHQYKHTWGSDGDSSYAAASQQAASPGTPQSAHSLAYRAHAYTFN